MTETQPLRILFAPREICGQMQLLAEGFRARGHVATAVGYHTASHGVQNDLCLHFEKKSRTRQLAASLAFTKQAIRDYDIFHFFFGRSLMPRNLDLPLLKRLGKKIFVHFRGSDIRSRTWVSEVVMPQALGRSPTGQFPRSTPRQLKQLAIWRRYAGALFVSIPELTEIVPEALVVQQTIDLCRWPYNPENGQSSNPEIVIGHATSNRKIKGTAHLVTAVNQLRDRGHSLRLDIIEGIDHKDVATRYRQCHIGVDELVQGSYGNVAIELMAVGKPVIANLGPWYRGNRPDCPIVHSGPAEIGARLEELISDRERRQQLGAAGRCYVEKWHDVRSLVDRLTDIYTHSNEEREL